MNPWTVLLIGILLGWLIEYVVDWFFWRRKPTDEQIVTDLQDQLQASEERAAGLEAQLAEAKSASETWQTRHDELETEMADAEDEEYDHEEFRGSLKGKLAALGIGASAGAAIATGADHEEETDESLHDEEITEATTAEPMDGESSGAEENSDAADESFDESSELDKTDDVVDSESQAKADNHDEDVMETSADEDDETIVADADSSEEAEPIEEVETVDQTSEPDETNLNIDENDDSADDNVPDLSFDDESPTEISDLPDEDALGSGEGGQTS